MPRVISVSTKTVDPLIAELRDRRARLLISQSELARSIGCTQSHISAIEAGNVSPNLGTLRRIMVVLGCDVTLTWGGHGRARH